MGFLWDSPKQKLVKKEKNELQRINSLIKGFKEENRTNPNKQLKNIIKSLVKQKKIIEQNLLIYQQIPSNSTQRQIDSFLESNKSILNHIVNATRKTLKKRISTPESMKSHEAKFSSSSSRGSVRKRSRIINRSSNPLDSPINNQRVSSSPYLPLEPVNSYDSSQAAKTIRRKFKGVQNKMTTKRKSGFGLFTRIFGKQRSEDKIIDQLNKEEAERIREEEKTQVERQRALPPPKFNLDNLDNDDYFK